MKFGVSKCANVIAQGGKFEPAEGNPNSIGRITDIETDKGYKYLGVLHKNKNMQTK